MKKEVSIVLSVERRNYRKVAQDWYGLTDEQMDGMDVHHNPARSEGGRNIPEHLYVYHNTLHSAIHEDEFVSWSRKGAKATNSIIHRKKDERGKSVHSVRNGKKGAKTLNAEKDELGRSVNAMKGATKAHQKKDSTGRSQNAVKGAEKANAKKDELGRSLASLKGALSLHRSKWEDPDHPELGQKPPGVLAMIQRRQGLPHGPENRRRVAG